jgi:membrane-associated protease RseP (regulator of RpoE activity)
MQQSDATFRRMLTAAVACCLLGTVAAWGAERNSAFMAALESIRADELKSHVAFLADDQREGREAGSSGNREAAEYLAQYLAEIQLTPAGIDGGFFQPFDPNYRNILALIQGSDPELRREFILVGAHYDHVGYGTKANSLGQVGLIHNGADDNASGVSGVLELAQAFTLLPQPTKRSILFVLWDAEEKGLFGSKHWLEHPTIPRERLDFAVNLDMIGRLRDDRLTVFGTRTGYGLRRLVSEQNEGIGLRLDFSWSMIANADHYSFFQEGVPTLFVHTGTHDQYHRPEDDVERINAPGMSRVARLLFGAVYELADEPRVTAFREASRGESPEVEQSLLGPKAEMPPRLGASWEPSPSGEGVRLSAIGEDSAAEKAGIKLGDTILELGGQKIRSGDDLAAAVMAAHNPVTVVVRRPEGEEPVTLTVQLDGEPLRLGISWRGDDADPGLIVLTNVVAHSPAARAGLETGDRIYRVAGRDFSGEDEFAQLVGALPGPLSLLVEREGQLRTVVIHFPAETSRAAA